MFIYEGLTVTNYNGIPVNWDRRTVVYLPPGTIDLTINALYDTGTRRISGRDWPFQWTFEAGERRYLRGWVDENGNPVIMVIEGGRRWMNEPYFRVPFRQGPIILQ